MDYIKRGVLISKLVDRLEEDGSWCGETHVQKAVYFLQELLEVPMDFEFILYMHSPFSFDLRDELMALRADGLLAIEIKHPRVASVVTTNLGKKFQRRFPKALTSYDSQISFVAEKLRGRQVGEQERLATALFVTLGAEDCSASIDDRARRLNWLQEHVPVHVTWEAVRELDSILEELGRRNGSEDAARQLQPGWRSSRSIASGLKMFCFYPTCDNFRHS